MSIGMRKQKIAFAAAFMAAAICAGQTVYAKDASSLEELKAGSEKVMESGGMTEKVRAGAADIIDREVVSVEVKSTEETVDVDEPEESAEDVQPQEDVPEVLNSESALQKEYPDLVMANVNNSVNVRSMADEESELIGKLYMGCAVSML